MQASARSVLEGVKRKQSEVRQYQDLLTALNQLREHRKEFRKKGVCVGRVVLPSYCVAHIATPYTSCFLEDIVHNFYEQLEHFCSMVVCVSVLTICLPSGFHTHAHVYAHTHTHAGDVLPPDTDEVYTQKFKTLENLLSKQIKDYEGEEHTLRVLMAEEVREKMSSQQKQGGQLPGQVH